MNPTGLLKQSGQRLLAFWAACAARERMMLIAAAATVLFALTYMLLIEPAMTGRQQLVKNLPLLRQQAAQLQSLSKEVAAISGNGALPVIALSKQNIEAALARNSLKPQSIMVSGDYAKVQLVAASFAGTLVWLDEMQKTALLPVVEANIVALGPNDLVDATLTLRQPGNE